MVDCRLAPSPSFNTQELLKLYTEKEKVKLCLMCKHAITKRSHNVITVELFLSSRLHSKAVSGHQSLIVSYELNAFQDFTFIFLRHRWHCQRCSCDIWVGSSRKNLGNVKRSESDPSLKTAHNMSADLPAPRNRTSDFHWYKFKHKT